MPQHSTKVNQEDLVGVGDGGALQPLNIGAQSKTWTSGLNPSIQDLGLVKSKSLSILNFLIRG
jgi:hypothetical protein